MTAADLAPNRAENLTKEYESGKAQNTLVSLTGTQRSGRKVLIRYA